MSSNHRDIIDSRDVIARILVLLSEDERDEDEAAELAALLALQEEAEGYCGDDWQSGAGLIRDSYFREYAEELADDIGAIDRAATWPLCHIDWEAAAASLRADYTPVEFDGVTYWIR